MKPKIRCAIYTRKSSEDGLEQEFNSLHAQREACTAYITSQKAEGWVLLPEQYDDGGISGGALNRPALQRLLKGLDDGLIDQFLVYKIDRLSRSLADFSKIVDRLDAVGASFVSVTQSFNTATSMGRLTLNTLLSFAQFEREVTAERIRDKIAASKRKGLWMGGIVPLGYTANGRTLKINETDAKIVKELYRLYLEHGSVRAVKEAADNQKLCTKVRVSPSGEKKGGKLFERGHVYHILANPIYAGRIRHRKNIYEGQHPAIIDPHTWDDVQKKLELGQARARSQENAAHRSPLAGKLFDETEDRLTPSHSAKNGKRLRYYVSRRLITDESCKHPKAWRLPALQLERAVSKAIYDQLAKPDALPKLVNELRADETDKYRTALKRLAGKIADVYDLVGWAKLTSEIKIAPGNLAITLDSLAIAKFMDIPVKRLNADILIISTTFQLRRRGVETKIILGNNQPDIDQLLVQNIAKAIRWFEAVKAGAPYVEIAMKTRTPKHRIQKAICLAFLAPDILQRAIDGTLPVHITSDFLIRHGVPADWNEQREMLTEPTFG